MNRLISRLMKLSGGQTLHDKTGHDGAEASFVGGDVPCAERDRLRANNIAGIYSVRKAKRMLPPGKWQIIG